MQKDLTQKARYQVGGDITNPPYSMTYANVVIQEIVRTDLLVAALNDLDKLAGDTHNAYLNAYNTENNFLYAGDE